MKKTQINPLVSLCKTLDFGTIKLTQEKIELYHILNKELLNLCKLLPESMQSRAIQFLMDYSRISPGQPLDFFSRYYPPVWSVLYHIHMMKYRIPVPIHESLPIALQGQAYAMFLHSLDDHLNDGDIPASHLALLLRSSAWMRFNECITYFTEIIPESKVMAKNLINDYYSGMMIDNVQASLEQYCARFRKQVATGLIMPLCMSKLMGIDDPIVLHIQQSYESFGVAWRLLDDIHDIEEDIKNRLQTAIYCSMPQKYSNLWNIEDNKKRFEKIVSLLVKEGIIDNIIQKIYTEMKKAEILANKAGLAELAVEFSELNGPIAAVVRNT
jgi:hypothetical protein